MLRKNTCIGLDEDVMDYLKKQEVSMAQFINSLVRMYRDKDDAARKAFGEIKVINPISDNVMKELVNEDVTGKLDRGVKIRAYFLDCPWIVYNAKTQRKFTKTDLCKIKDDLFWSKYNIDVTTLEIRTILKESIDAFDVESYLKRCKEAVPTVM